MKVTRQKTSKKRADEETSATNTQADGIQSSDDDSSDSKKNSKKKTTKALCDFSKTLSSLSDDMRTAEGNGFSLMRLSDIGRRERMMFGSAVLDYITGGGSPLYSVSSLWGAESSGKSSLLYDQIATAQNTCWRCQYPTDYCKCSLPADKKDAAIIAIEGVPDESWAEAIGVDLSRLYISLPESAEHGFDVLHRALHTDLCLAAIDSISMISPEAESSASAEQQFMALQSRAIGRFLRTTQNLLNKRLRANAPVAVTLINQMRFKVGMVMGSPETRSGGSALKHTDNLLVRVGGVSLNASVNPDKFLKASNNKKDSSGVRCNVSVHKKKFFTLGKSDSFVRLTANNENFPTLRPGQIIDAVPTIKVALACNVLEKTSSGYKFPFLDRKFANQQEIVDFITQSRQNKMLIVKEAISKAYEAYKHGAVAPDVVFGPTNEASSED